jgi:[ribosomal protein S18]-alanine N-acetyltransferase
MSPEAMAALHAACFTTPRPWSAAEFAALANDPLCFGIVESDGFLIGRVVADEAEILTLAVDVTARRRGIGARLVQGFLAEARSRDATTAFLEVAANNLAAISVYFWAGFAETGRRKRYYAQPDGVKVDALLLSRAL